MVQEQDAVQVVDLVLDRPRAERGCFDQVAPAIPVCRFDDDPLGAVHVAVDVGNGETPFLAAVPPFPLDDHGIDQDHRVVFAGVHHRDAVGGPDLVGGEAHALSRPHRVEQVVHQSTDAVVERFDLGSPLAQHR